MYKTAYDTLACRSYTLQELESQLKRAQLEGELQSLSTLDTRQPINQLKGVTSQSDQIPAFTHPLFVSTFNKDPECIIDIRPFFITNRMGQTTITNQSDYKFHLLRAIFNLHWVNYPEELLGLGDLAPIVFCRWLSESIVRRLGLGPGDQVRVMTVSLFYWYSLFRDREFDENEKLKVLSKLDQISTIPTPLSMEIVDDVTHMNGLEAYISVLNQAVGNPRLANLNPPLLFAMMGVSWFGINAKEIVAVAMEHPPTFIAIILSALESRSYKRSTLGTLVFDNDKKNRGPLFSRNCYTLIKQHLE